MAKLQNVVFPPRTPLIVFMNTATSSAMMQCRRHQLTQSHSSLKPVDAIDLARKCVLEQDATDYARIYGRQRDRIQIPKV